MMRRLMVVLTLLGLTSTVALSGDPQQPVASQEEALEEGVEAGEDTAAPEWANPDSSPLIDGANEDPTAFDPGGAPDPNPDN